MNEAKLVEPGRRRPCFGCYNIDYRNHASGDTHRSDGTQRSYCTGCDKKAKTNLFNSISAPLSEVSQWGAITPGKPCFGREVACYHE